MASIASFVGAPSQITGMELNYTRIGKPFVDHVAESDATHVSLYVRYASGEAEWIADFPKSDVSRAIHFAQGYAAYLGIALQESEAL
jgi:hypothetical protein